MSDQLPATQVGSDWPSQKTLRDAAGLLDMLVNERRAMHKARQALCREPDSQGRLQHAKQQADYYARYTRQHCVLNGEAQRLLDHCQPKSWHDENGEVRKSEAAKMLAVLIGSVQVPSNIDIPVFSMALLDHVMMLEPSYAVLASTCYRLQTTKKWLSIAEVVEEVTKQEDKWTPREFVLGCIEDVYAELTTAIAEAEKRQELLALAVERQQQAARIEHKRTVPVTRPGPSWVRDAKPVRNQAGPKWWRDE